MKKNLRIGFYRVEVASKQPVSFDDILEQCTQLPNDETRALPVKDGPITLQFVNKAKTVWIGDLVRLREHDDPKTGKRNGEVRKLPKADDESLCEQNAFLYDPEFKCLVYHEHRGGVTVGNAARYFKAVGQTRSLNLLPMLRPEALQRVYRMSRVVKFIVHLAGMDHGRALKGMGKPALALFRTSESFRAPTAQFAFSVGKEGGLDNIGEAISDLLRLNIGERKVVRKLVVMGAEADEKAEALINLISDRLAPEIPVELRGDTLSDAERHAAVYQAWSENREDLRAIYGAKT